MQRLDSTWLGLATLGVFTLGCNGGSTDDEVGSTVQIDDDADTTGDESMDTAGTTESTTGTTDESTDGTDTTDTADTADESTDGTDTTDTAETTGDGDFELIDAEFADGFATLVLTFSDAVGPVDGVDPSDFRISMALTITYDYMGMSYPVSYYTDPNVYLDENATPIGMTAIANGPDPDQISLTLEPIFDMDACAALDDLIAQAPPNYMPDGHFFPHYAPGNIPLTSEGGSALGPIGPDWVLTPEPMLYVPMANWPSLDPQVPIPCP